MKNGKKHDTITLYECIRRSKTMKSSTCYINLIQNRGNSISNLNTFLMQDNGDGFYKAVRLLKNNSQLRKNIHKNLFSNQIFNNYPHHLKSLSLEKILLWNCNIIKEYSEQICDFSKKKDVFEKLFLSSKYPCCILYYPSIFKTHSVARSQA